ncbi:hypothetical protein FWC31_00155, partial [Candidatus Saccharibacteria bacterium]|nr:hypothetical protein [Candidatus Saccharibacteria bacterium]
GGGGDLGRDGETNSPWDSLEVKSVRLDSNPTYYKKTWLETSLASFVIERNFVLLPNGDVYDLFGRQVQLASGIAEVLSSQTGNHVSDDFLVKMDDGKKTFTQATYYGKDPRETGLSDLIHGSRETLWLFVSLDAEGYDDIIQHGRFTLGKTILAEGRAVFNNISTENGTKLKEQMIGMQYNDDKPRVPLDFIDEPEFSVDDKKMLARFIDQDGKRKSTVFDLSLPYPYRCYLVDDNYTFDDPKLPGGVSFERIDKIISLKSRVLQYPVIEKDGEFQVYSYTDQQNIAFEIINSADGEDGEVIAQTDSFPSPLESLEYNDRAIQEEVLRSHRKDEDDADIWDWDDDNFKDDYYGVMGAYADAYFRSLRTAYRTKVKINGEVVRAYILEKDLGKGIFRVDINEETEWAGNDYMAPGYFNKVEF